MEALFCNQCGHQNPAGAAFCSACGAPLGGRADQTLTLQRVDPLQESPVTEDDIVVPVGEIPDGAASLIVRNGPQPGSVLVLGPRLTRLGRHPDSELLLDDITVSRRHAELENVDDRWHVRDAGSLNGTYLNGKRVDDAVIRHGDELQVGKFRMVFYIRHDG